MWFLMALWGLLSWLFVEVCVFLPLYLGGLVVVPLASRFAKRIQGVSVVTKGSIVAWANPVLNAIYGNDEDGILVPRYTPWTWWVRNPVTNMRFWPVISTMPSQNTKWVGNVKAIPPDGGPGWFLTWAGGYVGFRWQCASWGIWLGWKVNPRDARFVPEDDYRRWGIGTACQLLRF